MALTGRLIADFEQFLKAVDTVQGKLRDFEGGAEKVSKSLERMGNSFSGVKIIQEANILTKAIADAGGASTLTAREMARVNSTVTEAIAKYTALGQTAPKAMQDLAAATTHVGDAAVPATKSVGGLGGAFTQMFAAFSAASLVNKAVGALTDVATQAFETADALINLSNKTGLSTDTLQKMQFVAKQSGSDMGQFADAAFKMGVNIAEGTKKAREGAEALGLNWAALRAASPDDQFNMVVTALEAMEDPQQRNAAAVALFGKTAKEILPAIVDGYNKVASGATVAGNAQIKALDAAGDAWDRFKTRTTSAFINAAGTAILYAEALHGLSTAEQQYLKDGTRSYAEFEAAMIQALQNKAKFGDVRGGFAPPPTPTATTPPVPASYVASLREAEAGYKNLTAAKLADIAAALKLGKSNDDIINSVDGVNDAILNLVKQGFEAQKSAMGKSAEAAKTLAAAWKEYGSVAGSVDDELSANTIEAIKWDLARNVSQSTLVAVYKVTAAQVAAIADAMKKETEQGKVLAEIHNKLEAGTSDLNDAMKKVNSAELDAIRRTLDLTRAFERMREIERVIPAGFYQIGVALDTLGNKSTEIDDLKVKVAKADAATKAWNVSMRGLQESLIGAALVIGGQFGARVSETIGFAVDMVDAVGAVNKSLDAAGKAATAAGEGMADVASAATVGDMVNLSIAVYNLYANLHKANEEARYLAELRLLDERTQADFRTTTQLSEGLRGALAKTATAFTTLSQVNIDALMNAYTGLNGRIAQTPDELDKVRDAFENLTVYAAEAMHLAAIIEELGGAAHLTAAQMDMVAARTRLLFSIIELGGPLGQQAIHALDDTLMDFANAATVAGGFVSQFFLDTVKQAKEAGVELVGVAAYITGQLGDAASGLSDLLGGLQKSATAQAMKTAQAGIDALKVQIEKSSGSARTALEKQLADAEAAQKKLVGTFLVTEAQGAGLAAAVLGDFGAMVDGGATFRDALTKLQPAIDSLSAALTASGVEGGAAFGVLTDMSRVAQDAVTGPLVDALSGADRALKGLHNSGILNQEMFSGIATTAVDAYNKMIAGGATVAAANMFIAPTLQDLWRLQKDFNYEVDAATQAMINEAVAAGRVGDAHRPIAEQMLIATERIAEAVEGLADVFGVVLPKAAQHGATEIEKSLKGIKIPPIKIATEILPPEGGWPDRSDFPDLGPIVQEGGAQAFGGDYLVHRPTHFLAGEAGPERVSFTPQGRGRSGGGATTIVVKTYLDGRQVAEAVVPELDGVLNRLGLRR